MSLRKRKFSNTSLARNASNKCRNPATAATTTVAAGQPQPLNDLYQSFVLSVVDQAVLASPDVVAEQRYPPTGIPAVLQTANVVEESGKSVSSQVSHPIPLPPPVPPPIPPQLPESSFKAAGILAELITLRGSHLASVDSSKTRKSAFEKFVERPAQGVAYGPLGSSVLERFPSKTQGTSSSAPNQQPSGGQSGATKSNSHSTKKSLKDDDESRFLLSRLDMLNVSENEKVKHEKEDIERSHFVQELLLSMLDTDYSNSAPNSSQDGGFERAVPAECPRLSPPPLTTENPEPSSSLNSNVSSTTTSKLDSGKGKKSRQRQKKSNQPHGASNSNSTTQGSETTRVLQPPAGISARNLYSSDPESYDSGEEDEKVSEDDRPPSPRQRIGIRLQNHIYNPVRLAGISNSAPLPHYGREDVPTAESLGKHVH